MIPGPVELANASLFLEALLVVEGASLRVSVRTGRLDDEDTRLFFAECAECSFDPLDQLAACT